MLKYIFYSISPPKASGGESLRTVYKVGAYYQKALDDESQTKMNQPIEVDVGIIEGNGQYNPFKANIAIENPQAIYFDDSVYNEELAEMIGHLNYAIFEVYYYGKKQKFEKMVEEGTNVMNKFFTRLYKAYTQKTGANQLKFDKVSHFVKHLAKNNKIPFTLSDLHNYLKKIDHILSDNSTIKTKAFDLYDLVSEFCVKLTNYVYHD